jgi:hypothetical protein
MKTRSKLSASLLLAGLAAAAGPVLAQEIVEVTTVQIAPDYAYTAPQRQYYYVEPAPVYSEPAITVVAPRQDQLDEQTSYDAAYAIAADPRPWHGTIGIETRNNDVTLNGLVSTPGQAARAGQDARSVDGVRNVDNLIRSRVGGSY